MIITIKIEDYQSKGSKFKRYNHLKSHQATAKFISELNKIENLFKEINNGELIKEENTWASKPRVHIDELVLWANIS